MKKSVLAALAIVFILSISAFAIPAFADWEVTASWTASTGPINPGDPPLDHEDLLVGSEVIATIPAGDQTAVVFTRSDLSGEVVKVISYNTAGVPNAGYVLGTLEPISPPADASGGSIIIRWKQ